MIGNAGLNSGFEPSCKAVCGGGLHLILRKPEAFESSIFYAMNEETPMKKSKYSDAPIMSILKQAENAGDTT